LRWWLRLTGLLTLLGGVACIVAEPTFYGISALSTEVGRASGSSVPTPDADRTEKVDRAA
jgi:hypothetical protein